MKEKLKNIALNVAAGFVLSVLAFGSLALVKMYTEFPGYDLIADVLHVGILILAYNQLGQFVLGKFKK